jgi:ketosteroid isomerase-like protein
MSKENVELARKAAEAANRGGWESTMPFLHPDVVYHTYGQAPEAGVYRGRDAVGKYNKELFEHFDKVQHDLDEVIDADDRVVVVLTQRVWPRGSTEPLERHFAEVWSVRDGLLAERHSFSNKAEALEAAGLSE